MADERHDHPSGLTTWTGIRNFNNTQPGDGYLAITSETTGHHAVIDAMDVVRIEELLHGLRLTVETSDGRTTYEVEGDPAVLRAHFNGARILAHSRRLRGGSKQTELADYARQRTEDGGGHE